MDLLTVKLHSQLQHLKMYIYTTLTVEELLSQKNSDIQDFIVYHFVDHAINPKRVMLKFEDALPDSLSSYTSYTESEVKEMRLDPSSDWYLEKF